MYCESAAFSGHCNTSRKFVDSSNKYSRGANHQPSSQIMPRLNALIRSSTSFWKLKQNCYYFQFHSMAMAVQCLCFSRSKTSTAFTFVLQYRPQLQGNTLYLKLNEEYLHQYFVAGRMILCRRQLILLSFLN